MKITVLFKDALKDILNIDKISIDVFSYRDIISAIINLIPQSKQLINTNVLILDADKLVNKHELDFRPRSDTIYIVPAISGGNVSGFDSLGNLTQFYGTSTAIGNQELALTGVTRRVVESSLYGKAQTAFDVSQRAANRDSNLEEDTNDPTTGFGSLNLTSINGQNVPLIFGRVRTSGAVISQYIKHIQRGGIDIVRVSDYV